MKLVTERDRNVLERFFRKFPPAFKTLAGAYHDYSIAPEEIEV